MNTDHPAPLDFDTLRAHAIAAAQDASGNIWTDFNLHDPGVTLLEQTTFALTEVAYQGDHPVRDMLTSKDNSFRHDALALFDPQNVLPGRPVTMADIASYLSDLDALERVFVTAGPSPGLIDIVIIPHNAVDPEEQTRRTALDWQSALISLVRAHFNDVRLLATDIRHIHIATPKPVCLEGEIAIDAFAEPNHIVAEVVHQTRLLLKGLPAALTNDKAITGATRADAFDDVSALWPELPANAGDATRFEAALATLKHIKGIEKITAFALADPETGEPFDRKEHGNAGYHDPVLPRSGEAMNLRLTRDGAAVALNLNTISEELGRLEAARIARQGNRKDQSDWDVLYPGKYRAGDRLPLDATLPAPYRAFQQRQARASKKPKTHMLADYRGMMDHHLDQMIAPLGVLDQTYVRHSDINLDDPASVRHRLEMLDYLIALQGEEMPAPPIEMHIYRSIRARLERQITWRETYLAALPAYNRYSGTNHPRFGLAARLAHLADCATPDDITTDMLGLDDQMALPAPPMQLADLILPVRPLDALVIRDDTVDVLSLPKLIIACPWIVDGKTTPALFQRATQPDAYILARNRKGDWEVLFQPQDDSGFYPCGTNHSRAKVEIWANRLRKTFAALNERAEKLWLIEDIQLRENVTDYAPATATLLLPGWTARTQQPAYRRYVEGLITRLAPAHMFIRPAWITWASMTALKPQLADWESQTGGSGMALRKAINDIIGTGDTS